MPANLLFPNPTRNLFFTGKGGVGKTTMACSTAVRLADNGSRVLLVSTDPASNLHDVLGAPIGNFPTPIPNVPGLAALNIDPVESARRYRERLIAPYRGILPDSAVAGMEEQLSGSCTVEIAAFDEFSRLLGSESATTEYDYVIYDTAPTGHTLRLLSLPAAWSDYISENTTGTSCLGPLAGLKTQQALYENSVRALADAANTTLVLVTRPEPSALREAGRTSLELRELGVRNQRLIVNGVFRASTTSDPFAMAMESRCRMALEACGLPAGEGSPDAIETNAEAVLSEQRPEAAAETQHVLANLPRQYVRLLSSGVTGPDSLRQVGASAGSESAKAVWPPPLSSDPLLPPLPTPGLQALIEQMAENGRGVIMTMGKGGVGKTTVAAAVAVGLADRGCEVLLSTTDPAAHLDATLTVEELPLLTIARIDPQEEVARYRDEVLKTLEADSPGRDLLEEDLRSPCTEEVAVFRAFAQAVAEGEERFVVLDTAPTGHTVLLLDAALSHHREVARKTGQVSEGIARLLPRLRDPNFTRLLVITVPEATPVHEAAQLQEDLRRADIEPYAWVVNQSLQPLQVTDPILVGRKRSELSHLEQVMTQLSTKTALLPWTKQPPVGMKRLKDLAMGSERQSNPAAGAEN